MAGPVKQVGEALIFLKKFSAKLLFRYLLCAAVVICTSVSATSDMGLEKILIISIDALHPDALTAQTSKNIYRLMKQGAYTLDGKSTNPPLTLLAHAAMFSGLSPEESGRTDNSWKKNDPVIKGETIFNTAASKGYTTGFFYSKSKLGYLVNPSVDHHKFDADFSVENALDFLKDSGRKKFCFLHISGLDRTGPIEGWMSPGYLEELFFIDEAISPLIHWLESKANYLIIITSDHAGHGTIHGSDHPDDAKLPLVMASDKIKLKKYQGMKYHVTQLKSLLENLDL